MKKVTLNEILNSEQEKDRLLLRAEVVLGAISVISFLTLILISSTVEMELWLRITLIAIAFSLLISGLVYSLKIEQVAGYYECNNCHHKYIPKYFTVFFAMHIGRTRYMQCPECGESTWNKKTLIK